MKTILTHTYFLAEDEAERRVMKPYPPLGLLYLSAWLKKHDLPVEVIDTTFSNRDRLQAELEQKQPDVLGIHCNMRTKFTVLWLIDFCRERGITTILGGPDASAQVEQFLRYGADIVVSGEGEDALLAVLKRLPADGKHGLQEIPNVSFKTRQGQLVHNGRQTSKRRLDDFPFPDREAIDLHAYFDTWQRHHAQRPLSLVTARGCAFRCKWCSHSVYGHTHRRRTPANVVEEIKQIMVGYQPTQLWFADDVFTANTHWLRKFAALMEKENLHLPFECIGRADRFNAETAQLLKQLGCFRLWLGAESGSNRVLQLMDRGVTREQVFEAQRLCREQGIETGIFIMFGYPGEQLEDIEQTVSFVRDLQPDRFLTTVAYPLRGTRMYDEIKERIRGVDGWEREVQTELDIAGRYSRELYDLAIRRTASAYRLKQLRDRNGSAIKRIFHFTREKYCARKMKQLAGQGA